MLNLAVRSSKRVLRLRGSSFVLESLWFDEVLIEFRHRTLASDTIVGLFVRLVLIGVEPACHMSRVWHRTHAPDASRCVRSLTQRGCKMSFLTGCVQGEGIGCPCASGVVRVFKPQLAIGETPDSLRERPV